MSRESSFPFFFLPSSSHTRPSRRARRQERSCFFPEERTISGLFIAFPTCGITRQEPMTPFLSFFFLPGSWKNYRFSSTALDNPIPFLGNGFSLLATPRITGIETYHLPFFFLFSLVKRRYKPFFFPQYLRQLAHRFRPFSPASPRESITERFFFFSLCFWQRMRIIFSTRIIKIQYKQRQFSSFFVSPVWITFHRKSALLFSFCLPALEQIERHGSILFPFFFLKRFGRLNLFFQW